MSIALHESRQRPALEVFEGPPGPALGPWVRFVVGFVAATMLLCALGEGFLRWFPPKDSWEYLGDAAARIGPFAADAEFGVAYQSWESFHASHARELEPYLPLNRGDGRPTWALFGNSFVQMQGMLADHMRANVPGIRVFNLGRNELLPVRFAQARLLLEHGLRPERIVVELMPLDTVPIGQQPPDSYRVTARGALTYEPTQPPAPIDALTRSSALARSAWFRTGWHVGNPRFHHSQLRSGVPARLMKDLRHLFAGLSRAADQQRVPVTVLLIPNHEQISRGASFAFQDALTPMLRGLGLDVCDPRAAFLAQPNKPSLFIPDKHFSNAGNDVLLRELMDHVRAETAMVGGAS